MLIETARRKGVGGPSDALRVLSTRVEHDPGMVAAFDLPKITARGLYRPADVDDDDVGPFFDDVDMLLTPAANGEAPEGLDWTGDVRFQTLWSFLHVPAITLPSRPGKLFSCQGT